MSTWTYELSAMGSKFTESFTFSQYWLKKPRSS